VGTIELSIIIVNWNTRDFLRNCLQSIRSNPPACSFETIVVDNASGDGSAEMTSDEFPEVRLIAEAENLKYAEGNNVGMRAASGVFLLLLNPDTEVRPGTLDALLDVARANPACAAISCRLIGHDGKVQSSCRSFPDPRGVLFEYLRLSRLFPKSRLFGSYRMTYFDYEHEAEVDQPMASCLLIPRKAMDDVGVFDPEFPIFFNEVDWCFRAKEKGWKILFTPSAEILHLGGASTRQVRPEMVRESHRSLRRFYEKHYKSRISKPIYYLIAAAIFINSYLASGRRPRV
jgi:hypothetical protein